MKDADSWRLIHHLKVIISDFLIYTMEDIIQSHLSQNKEKQKGSQDFCTIKQEKLKMEEKEEKRKKDGQTIKQSNGQHYERSTNTN